MLIKTGDLRDDSKGDIDMSKKAEFIEAEGFKVADKDNKDKLEKPVKLEY